jgi:hypothetical protein
MTVLFATPSDAHPPADPLDAFASEMPVPHLVPEPPRTPTSAPHIHERWPWPVWGGLIAATATVILGVAQTGPAVLDALDPGAPPAAGSGFVYVESLPSGVPVLVDGRAAGLTPVRLSLSERTAVIEVQHEGVTRRLPLTVNPGDVVRQRIEFIAQPPAHVSIATPPTGTVASLPAMPTAVPAAAPAVDALLATTSETAPRSTDAPESRDPRAPLDPSERPDIR